jgi:hypothetical protein
LLEQQLCSGPRFPLYDTARAAKEKKKKQADAAPAQAPTKT